VADRSVLEIMADLLRRGPPSSQAQSRQGAELINEALPDELSARPAVLRKREQLDRLDAQTAENPTPEQRAMMIQMLRGQ